jgi:hypothetical protein
VRRRRSDDRRVLIERERRQIEEERRGLRSAKPTVAADQLVEGRHLPVVGVLGDLVIGEQGDPGSRDAAWPPLFGGIVPGD